MKFSRADANPRNAVSQGWAMRVDDTCASREMLAAKQSRTSDRNVIQLRPYAHP